MPSILLFVFSFICSGGGLGTFIEASKKNKSLNELEKINLRKFCSIIMLISSIIFLFFGLTKFNYLYKNLKETQKYCKLNNNKPKGEFYLLSIEQREELLTLKKEEQYIFKNNLTCLEDIKCVQLSKKNSFICNSNSQNFISFENKPSWKNNSNCMRLSTSDINKIFALKEINTNFFIHSCAKNKYKKNDIFSCDSDLNEKNHIIDNKTSEIIEKEYERKMEIFNKNLSKINEFLLSYNGTDYCFDLECFEQIHYFLSYVLINCYSFCFYFLASIWIFIGFIDLLKLISCIKDQEIYNYWREKDLENEKSKSRGNNEGDNILKNKENNIENPNTDNYFTEESPIKLDNN